MVLELESFCHTLGELSPEAGIDADRGRKGRLFSTPAPFHLRVSKQPSRVIPHCNNRTGQNSSNSSSQLWRATPGVHCQTTAAARLQPDHSLRAPSCRNGGCVCPTQGATGNKPCCNSVSCPDEPPNISATHIVRFRRCGYETALLHNTCADPRIASPNWQMRTLA